MARFFYKPEDGWVGDFIPYFDQDKFKLFYLKDPKNGEKEGFGRSWCLVTTKDFVEYDEQGATGIYGGTGSITKSDKTYHMFYCDAPSSNRQIISHAVSKDLENWKKKPQDDISSKGEIYEESDWRDPHVFWNDKEEEYWMLTCARTQKGISERKGCIGLCTSQNLKDWEIKKPLYAPHSHKMAYECPDIFKWGDWWYLIFSTLDDKFGTFYRMSKSIGGPWIRPSNDIFDGGAFYAGKTYKNGTGNKIYTKNKKRYIFGWNPTKEREYGLNPENSEGVDQNSWDWGGNLVVHQLIQRKDGTLGAKIPKTVDNAFNQKTNLSISKTTGNWDIENDHITNKSVHCLSQAFSEDSPGQCQISGEIKFKENTKGLGIALRVQEDLVTGYNFELEPTWNRIIFQSYKRQEQDNIWNTLLHETKIERQINLKSGKNYKFKILIDGSICEFYLNDEIAISTRMYDLEGGGICFFVEEGNASFGNVKIEKRQ